MSASLMSSRAREGGVAGGRQPPAEANRETETATQPANAESPGDYKNGAYEYADESCNYFADHEAVAKSCLQNDAEIPLTAENLIRSYEIEDWEPPSHCWFVDIILETFMSFEFRLYFFLLLYCAGVLLLTLSLKWTFEVLFRMHAPLPNGDFSALLTLSFSVIFFLLSFSLVTFFCTWIDMLKGLWRVNREDTKFWGVTHFFWSKTPPYIVYFFIIVFTTLFPFLWAFIDVVVNEKSFLFFLQTYAYIAIIVTLIIIMLCYVWFYWRALKLKRSVFRRRMERDEFLLWEKALRHDGLRPLTRRWYHATTVLEEYGLDYKTLRWNAVVMTIGCVPLFGVYMSQALLSCIGDPKVIWGAVVTLVIACVYFISWITMFPTRAFFSVHATLFLIAVMVLLGIVCSAFVPSKEACIAIILLYILSHGMLARKIRHSFTKKEQCELFQLPKEFEAQNDAQRQIVCETHLFCCRDAFLRCLRCFDVKTFFGYRHPDLVFAERQYEMDNVAVRTDQKVLFCWWLTVTFVLAATISLGGMMTYRFVDRIAAKGNPIPGKNMTSELCKIKYNTNGSAALGIYDLSLLSALSYTLLAHGDEDFVTWFSHLPSFIRKYPHTLPPNFEYATSGLTIPFSHYVDLDSDYHFITLNANNRGLSFMRNVDEWGTSIALQIAGVLSPFISIWPEKYRASFIYGVSFLQRWFSHFDALRDVSLYIKSLIAAGKKDRVLLVGDQFNGGYVKILSLMHKVPFVAFNPPGTMYKHSLQVQGVQVVVKGAFLPQIDSLEDTPETIYLECDPRYLSDNCGRIETTIKVVQALCGDPHGRRIK